MNLKKRTMEAATLMVGSALLLALMAPSAGAYGTPKPPKSLFAGYTANDQGGAIPVTSATATIILPTITCVKKNTQVDLEATLTTAEPTKFAATVEVAEVTLGCLKVRHVQNLVPTYSAGVYAAGVVGAQGSITPMPGDTITITLSDSFSEFSSTVDDVTSGQSVSTGTSTTSNEDAGVLSVGAFQAPPGLPELSNFAWTNLTLNGGPLSSTGYTYGATNWFWAPRKGTLTTGPLTSGGTAFTETYAPPAL